MSRHIDCLRAQFQNDLQQVMTVKPQDRSSVRMDIPDLLQLGRNPLRILKTGQEDQAVHFTDFPILLINGADLACYDKPRDHFPRDHLVLDPVLIFQHIESVLCRLQLLRQFLPPCRMSEIAGAHDMYPFLSRPQIQMLRRAVFARRPGISGMNM